MTCVFLLTKNKYYGIIIFEVNPIVKYIIILYIRQRRNTNS